MELKEEKHSQAAVLGLQHLLAMYSGSILVPIMIAGALGYSSQQLTYLISTDIFMCGVATFLQLQLNKYFGIGLPVVLGVAFQSVAPLIMIGQKHGSGAMFGALIVSGIYVLLIAGIFSKIANFFPPIVTGSVITTIGLTLIPVAIGNMGNNSEKPTAQSLLLAAVTILIILLVNIFAKGFLKSISILIGLIIGTIIASFMGLVDFAPVTQAPLVHVPTPFYFGIPKFELSSIVMMCIIATVSLVESTGVYFALSDITNEKLDSIRLRNGYRAEGLAVLLGGIFNTFPYTGFSQNVGLVKLSGIKTRLPIYYAAGFLVLLGADTFAAPLQGILRGYKDTKVPFYLGLIGYWGVSLPVGLLLDHMTNLGPFAYWIGLISSLVVSGILYQLRLNHIQKRN
ncbi:permease family protein [Streptococcus anginosus subsp. whileyi CCUG 39159]|uniref:Permease family protein n=1 Tax=Streptococcus anginosus subsp. whileyi CCUG 39159 TaxID=1095729 RepID=I0SJ19_STRAP|nr:solute carrier family 23 protein [Streptococcus anginosus]EID23372.1 permease family protein [Streptococcus anginosus subsp. whileyi CCUG 39159]MDP1384229.1 solute carrier family 23 protein [Streptococcus anginosus]